MSAGPEFGLPIGNLSSAYSWTFGGSIQADIPIVDNGGGNVSTLGLRLAYTLGL